MQNAETDCLFTTVRNLADGERSFGFLGEHGMRLAANEQVSVRGDLITKLGAMTSARRFKALQRALDDHSVLEIVSTPAVILYDAVAEGPKQLAINNGVLGFVDPCWMSSGSSAFVEG